MQPNLLNPILVEIKQVDDSATVFSNRRREPVNRVKRSVSFKVNAQIVFMENVYIDATKGKSPDERNLGGVIENAVGYIIVRKTDLQSVGKTLDIGDQIVSYGNVGVEEDCKYFLIGKKDAAHYSDIGQCTLEKWFFEDRS